MENLNMFVGQYIGVICVVLLGLLFFSIGIGCGLRSRMSELQKKYDFFTQGKEANIDEVLTATLNELHKTQAELAEMQEKHAKLYAQTQNCLQNVKMVRYDAFDAMGGEMSYSLLLEDAKNNGVILTSIYGRDESRCFAKDVKDGKSSYVLADEEKELLK